MKIRYTEYENGKWSVEREVKGWVRTRWEMMLGCYWKDDLTGAIWYYPRPLKPEQRTYRSRFDSFDEAKSVLARWILNEVAVKNGGDFRQRINAEITVDTEEASRLYASIEDDMKPGD